MEYTCGRKNDTPGTCPHLNPRTCECVTLCSKGGLRLQGCTWTNGYKLAESKIGILAGIIQVGPV